MEMEFKTNNFSKRIKSMLSVDFRRMFTMPLFYIMVSIAFVTPILILVMTTMMDGTVTIDPNTGKETVIEGFKNVWQSIGVISSENSSMSMDLVSMCNINMMYFALSVLICIFVSNDFRSGYSKNLFTVRAKKNDYVISKSLVGFVGGSAMIIAYFLGAMIGGAISNLSFELGQVSINNIAMCMISKVFLVSVFTAIFLVMSIVGKQRLWLSLICSLGASMLLFTMIPMITPLDSSIINVVLCLFGGMLFNLGLGYVSNIILKKTSLL